MDTVMSRHNVSLVMHKMSAQCFEEAVAHARVFGELVLLYEQAYKEGVSLPSIVSLLDRYSYMLQRHLDKSLHNIYGDVLDSLPYIYVDAIKRLRFYDHIRTYLSWMKAEAPLHMYGFDSDRPIPMVFLAFAAANHTEEAYVTRTLNEATIGKMSPHERQVFRRSLTALVERVEETISDK